MTKNSLSTARPIAATLPVKSVVATGARALFKHDMDLELCWASTAGGSATNEQVDEYILRGATILREGTAFLPKVPKTTINTTTGQSTMNRLISRLKESAPPEDAEVDKPTPEFLDRDAIRRWNEARLLDESHLTDAQRFSRDAPCSDKSPHNPHNNWGRFKDLICPGFGADPENLSFGSVVAYISTNGKVVNWLKVTEEARYAWRDDKGHTRGHNTIVKDVKKGACSIIRWGV